MTSITEYLTHDPLVLATWALVVVTGGLAMATVVLVRAQTKAMIQTLRTEALARFTEKWDAPEMQARRRHVAGWLIAGGSSRDAESGYKITAVIDFFEDLGSLLRLGRLDFDLVWHAFSDTAVGWWEAGGAEHVKCERERWSDPALYSEYEDMLKKLERENRRKVPGYDGWHREDVVAFLESERDLILPEPTRVVLMLDTAGMRTTA
jgi:hypothetical protein